MRDIPDSSNYHNNYIPEGILVGEDPNHNLAAKTESDAFVTAYSVLNLYNRIHHSFNKEFVRMEDCLEDIKDFLMFVFNAYIVEECPATVDYSIYEVEEILVRMSRVLRHVTQVWRRIYVSIGHIVESTRKEDICRTTFPGSAIPGLTDIYHNLRYVNRSMGSLKIKRKEYFDLKCYVLSHVNPN